MPPRRDKTRTGALRWVGRECVVANYSGADSRSIFRSLFHLDSTPCLLAAARRPGDSCLRRLKQLFTMRQSVEGQSESHSQTQRPQEPQSE